MPHAAKYFGVIAFLIMPATISGAERCDELAGRIIAVDTLIEVAAGVSWRSVQQGETLCVGDILRVGEADRAVILLEGGVAVQLARGSTVRIVEASPGGRTWLRLLSGIIRLFARRPLALEVDTPFANAAVEGTEFTVQVEPDRARITVLEGRVRFSNLQGTVRLDPGSSAVAVAGRAPEIELRIRPRDAVEWALYYPPLGMTELVADAPAPMREAVRLQAEGKRQAALAQLEAVRTSARGATYYTLLAELLVGIGRLDEAQAALADALARSPNDSDALALLSVMAIARNNNEEALAHAQRAVDSNPRNARALLSQSYAAQATFDIPLARESLEAAVKAQPNNALAWARLAEVELMQGDIRAATRSAEHAASLNPANARAQTILGFVALARIDTRAATTAFSRSLKLEILQPASPPGSRPRYYP